MKLRLKMSEAISTDPNSQEDFRRQRSMSPAFRRRPIDFRNSLLGHTKPTAFLIAVHRERVRRRWR